MDSTMQSMARFTRLSASILLCAGVVVVTGCAKKEMGEPKAATANESHVAPSPRREVAPVVVTTMPVTTRTIQRTVEAVGTFYGRDEVVITPKVTGRVKKIYFDMGDAVKPGDLLLEIEDIDFRLAVEEAQKSLESELAKLGLRELPTGEFDLTVLPTIVRTRLLVENAASKLKRGESLLEKKITTVEEYEQLKTDFDVAKSDYQQAAMDAQSTLAAARQKAALLETARQHLLDTKLFAPKSSAGSNISAGDELYFVAERMVTEGEMVEATPMTAVFKLVIDDPLKLRISAPEREVSQIKNGQSVQVTVDAYGDRRFPGQISRISPAVDLASRTFDVEILVPNSKHELKTGNFGKAEIMTHEDNNALVVPADSIISFAGVTKVFIVSDGKAQGVEIRLGVRGTDWCEVSGPLKPGMQVVTSGYTKLADGTIVQVRAEGAASTPKTANVPAERLSER